MVGLISLIGLAAATLANAGDRSSDREAILGLIEAFAAGWGHRDAHGLSMLWRADGDFTVPDGTLLKGRTQIETFYASVFATGYGGSRARATIDQVRFLCADFAVIDGQIEITGRFANKQELPPERGYFTAIVQKFSRHWEIVVNREMEPPLGPQARLPIIDARPRVDAAGGAACCCASSCGGSCVSAPRIPCDG